MAFLRWPLIWLIPLLCVDRSQLVGSFVWLFPFLHEQRKKREREKKKEKRKREIPPNSGLTYRHFFLFYPPKIRLTHRQHRCVMLCS